MNKRLAAILAVALLLLSSTEVQAQTEAGTLEVEDVAYNALDCL